MIIIKQNNSHQVAHLYEHLFCMAVEDLFYHKHLFPYVDYQLSSQMLRGGIIYVNITLHTSEAKQLIDKLPELTIPLNDRSIHTAIIQIISEKEQYLGTRGVALPTLT